MPERARRPTLGDLYRMGRQLDSDRELSTEDLRRRDHAIGQRCAAREDSSALLYWLDEAGASTVPALAESQLAVLLRFCALCFGAAGMAGFMLASGRALVNVPLFLLIFVLVQFALCLLAAFVTFRSMRGEPPAAFLLNPARLVIRRGLPESRYLRENAPVLRLLLLRYGQEFGALFALGAALAFVVLLAFADFSFVWGSTFAVSDEAVRAITRVLSAPWSVFLPEATVSPQVIADTRYHASELDLGGMAAASRRGWWPFLLLCLLVYTLLPRLALWLLSLWGFRRQLDAALRGWPGAASVLARMRAPVVDTRAQDAGEAPAQPAQIAAGAVLLDWAGALAGAGTAAGLPPEALVTAGLGSPAEDVEAIAAVNRRAPPLLLVAVKGWEPPMADLGDVLAELDDVAECRLLLVPLPGRDLSEAQLGDWRAFAGRLPFQRKSVEAWRGSTA